MDNSTLEHVALMLVRERRIAMALAPASHWPDLYGLRMLRLEFPHLASKPGAHPHEQALALSVAVYGCGATLLPSVWTYGPSPRHAIDRQPSTHPTDAPFLHNNRKTPPENPADTAPQNITIEVFRAAPEGEFVPNPQMTAGALWLPLAAIRALTGGMAIAEALSLDGVEAHLAIGVTLPENGFVFLPSDVGERMLSRIGAKYGEGALFSIPSPLA